MSCISISTCLGTVNSSAICCRRSDNALERQQCKEVALLCSRWILRPYYANLGKQVQPSPLTNRSTPARCRTQLPSLSNYQLRINPPSRMSFCAEDRRCYHVVEADNGAYLHTSPLSPPTVRGRMQIPTPLPPDNEEPKIKL